MAMNLSTSSGASATAMRLLQYFVRQEGKEEVNVLVATSGDTGSAVANAAAMIA